MAHPTSTGEPKNRRQNTWLWLALVVFLAVVPYFLHPTSSFKGTDDSASQVITQIAPAAKPWLKPLWSPPSQQTESLLFAWQAALGAGFIGYFIGLKQGEKRAKRDD